MEDVRELSVNASNLFIQGKYSEALSVYLKILSERFNDSVIHGNIAMSYEMLGEYELAVAHYKKSIRLDENNVRSVNNLARVYLNIVKDLNIAAQYLEHAIKISPNDAEAYNLYGNLHIINEEYDLAEKYFNKSILLDEGFFKNYYDLALVQKAKNKHFDAVESLNRCLKLRPDFQEAAELLEKIRATV